MDRAHAGIEIQALAQADIDRSKPFAHRGCARTFQGHAVPAYQIERSTRQGIAIALGGTHPRLGLHPRQVCAGSTDYLLRCRGYFRTDAVPRDKHDRCRHVTTSLAAGRWFFVKMQSMTGFASVYRRLTDLGWTTNSN